MLKNPPPAPEATPDNPVRSAAAEELRSQYEEVLIDEYQDTNTAQFELIRLLAGKYKNLCVVGDDDQSIYKFRGANIYNILNFEKHFPDAVTIKLEQNYRSTQNILKRGEQCDCEQCRKESEDALDGKRRGREDRL